MGFKRGKNGLLKRTGKPQLTRKQNRVLKLQKKLDAIASKSAQSKNVITRRDGEIVNTKSSFVHPHVSQTRLVKLEESLDPFVKKDENGKIVGYEFPEDSTDTVNLLCPKCQAPMELKKPQAGQNWQPFWGCSMYSVTGCKGNGKDLNKKQEVSANNEEQQQESDDFSSIIGNQDQSSELQIVKQNKQGEYFVNKSIQSESKGSLSWNDVIDLIDEALDEAVYPEQTLEQLEAYREQILIRIENEQGIVAARKPPKKTDDAKELQNIYVGPKKHTYSEVKQNKEYRAEVKVAKLLARNKQLEIHKTEPKEKFKINTNSRSPNCPICEASMKKREPKKGQTWKAFWGCTKYPKCKGTVNL